MRKQFTTKSQKQKIVDMKISENKTQNHNNIHFFLNSKVQETKDKKQIQNKQQDLDVRKQQQDLPNIPSNQEDIPPNQEKIIQKSFFDQYIEMIKSKLLKRKIILFILNVLLVIQTFTFAIFFIIFNNTDENDENLIKITQIFNSQSSILILICILVIVTLSVIFSIVIFKGKVLMLHCYWISCLVFLIIFSIIASSAFTITNMNCQQPSNYILQKIRLTSLSGISLFCSEACSCQRSGYQQASSGILYKSVQGCPGWQQTVYSQFFSMIQQQMKCSGWCQINNNRYFSFYQSLQTPNQNDQKSCFRAIQQKIESDTEYLRIFCIITCILLVTVIFYTNYYIFMQKEDQNRQIKKLKRKMKQVDKRMEDQLKTSKRMLD